MAVPRHVTVEIEFTAVGNLIIDLARLIAEYHDELPDDLVQKARDLVAVAEEHEED